MLLSQLYTEAKQAISGEAGPVVRDNLLARCAPLLQALKAEGVIPVARDQQHYPSHMALAATIIMSADEGISFTLGSKDHSELLKQGLPRTMIETIAKAIDSGFIVCSDKSLKSCSELRATEKAIRLSYNSVDVSSIWRDAKEGRFGFSETLRQKRLAKSLDVEDQIAAFLILLTQFEAHIDLSTIPPELEDIIRKIVKTGLIWPNLTPTSKLISSIYKSETINDKELLNA